MNGRQSKKIRRKAKELTIEWLKSLIPEEEAKKISIENFDDYMPDQKYVYANRQFRLSAFSDRWFAKHIKRTDKDLDTITFTDFNNEL
tara:strand:+ start:253 stop:516 length:264 start_codon:yes stop_codon:yes gene_type:complete